VEGEKPRFPLQWFSWRAQFGVDPHLRGPFYKERATTMSFFNPLGPEYPAIPSPASAPIGIENISGPQATPALSNTGASTAAQGPVSTLVADNGVGAQPKPETSPDAQALREAEVQRILSAPVRRSRMLGALVIVALLVLALFAAIPTAGRSFGAASPVQLSPENIYEQEAAAATVPTAAQLASLDQQTALSLLAQNGSLAGFQPAAGGEVVYGVYQSVFVAGRSYQDQCWVYALISGSPSSVEVDPSGYGCTPAAIDQFRVKMTELGAKA
jgi:hypothetical protein